MSNKHSVTDDVFAQIDSRNVQNVEGHYHSPPVVTNVPHPMVINIPQGVVITIPHLWSIAFLTLRIDSY